MPRGAYKRTKTRRKINSESHRGLPNGMLGKRHSKKTKRKMSKAQKGEKGSFYGKHHSKITKRRMRESKVGDKNPAKRLEVRKKISDAKKKNPIRYWLGKHRSDDTKEKLRQANLGKHHSEESRKKMGMKGKKNPMWKGGISINLYSSNWTDDLRDSIRKRDNRICQECGIHQDELTGFHKLLDIHHIDYDKNNLDPKNLISLCRSCHMKTNSNRNYWINHFKKL